MGSNRIEGPSLRLARYLKEFVGLRSTTIRDVAQYESLVWFGDMPQEPDCRSGAGNDDIDPEEPWLEVRKQQFTSPPEPPRVTVGWVDAGALRKATNELPPLHPSIFVEDAEAELEEGETPPLAQRQLSDHPEVVEAYEAFRPKWETWSAGHRRREAVQKVYGELFRFHNQLQKRGEVVEVVLGLGLVDWRAKIGDRTIPIRRHALAAQVELTFDAQKGIIRVGPPGDGARLRIEDDMLEAEFRPDRTHYAAVVAQLQEVGDAIWDKSMMHTALKTWAAALSADSTWSEALDAKSSTGNDPALSFAPALILRPRLQTGMVRVYERMIEQLGNGDGSVPAGWGRLIDDDWDDGSGTALEPQQPDDERNAPAPPVMETYFPLPANREQRRIVDALTHNQGVLVQGPPGTGKSHTIANLMCHLLATGKRVLITAETGRALQVLKDKLPEEIQPLCVSLLGQGGDAFAELNAAVQGITNRHSSYSRGAYDDRVAEIDDELDSARRRLAEIDWEIRSLREDETCQHSLLDGRYQGTASKIAARIANERARIGWLEPSAETGGQPLITNAEALQWLDIRRRYSDQDIEASSRRIPDSVSLIEPKNFAGLVTNEARVRASSEKIDEFRFHSAFLAIRSLSKDARDQLKVELKDIEERRLALQPHYAQWLPMAIRDGVVGRDSMWRTLLEVSRVRVDQAERLLSRIEYRTVSRPEGLAPRRLRRDAGAALEHFQAGGKWKRFGFATPKGLKGRTYLKKNVLVDGQPADDVENLRIVCDDLDLEFTLTDLENVWKDLGVTEVAADRRLCLATYREHMSILVRALDYIDTCGRVAEAMSRQSPPLPTPDWLLGEAQNWMDVIDAADIDHELEGAARQVESCGQAPMALRQLHDVHPVVRDLLAAVDERNVTGYSEGYSRLVAIEKTREAQEARLRIEAVIEESAPRLIAQVEASLDDSIWDARLAEWEEAWRWAVVHAWLEQRSDFNYQQRLWRKRHDAEGSIGRLISEAASLRAWTHFFDRLSTREANALRSWREAVRAMGKGTGRSARLARLRQDARRYMDACRGAIPIWIMPRYLVAEMVDPAPERYDLVIVDEASQLGIESLFLFYIAKKVIIVGDDQQISPAGVGIADAGVAGLQQRFLDGVPHQHALSPQSSLYANAKIRFNQNIVLREHFRCMPEIIQFSNDLCYASNGTALDPLRAYPANRLEPLVLRHIPNGYRTGRTQYAQNPPEAEAIVAQICACIDDPRYAGFSMGVISLQGEAQAKLIENMLLGILDPEVIEDRRLICGDAYAFQGDERNVVFLSMVAAPGEMRIGALTNEAARQRFNVAVSRAQDQLWLFHTAELEMLSTACMRHRLLSYMLEPRRRRSDASSQRFDSDFERDVYKCMTDRGFHVRTQVCVGDPTNHRYRIDLVVEGMEGRLAVECDGDEWHGPDRYEQDMARQRDLERAGWQFARIRGGDFYSDPERALKPVWAELGRLNIRPGGINGSVAEPPQPKSIDLQDRFHAALQERISSAPPPPEMMERLPDRSQQPVGTHSESAPNAPVEPAGKSVVAPPMEQERLPRQPTDDLAPQLLPSRTSPSTSLSGARRARRYVAFEGQAGPDPRHSTTTQVAEGLCRVIDREGPMLAKRAYDLYLRGSGIRRMGRELRRSMNKALQHAIRTGRVVKEHESGNDGLVHSIVRPTGAPAVVLRERGSRNFEEIPPSELQLVARRLSRDAGFESGSDDQLRALLEFFDLKRLTVQVGTRLLDALARRYSYVDEVLGREEEESREKAPRTAPTSRGSGR